MTTSAPGPRSASTSRLRARSRRRMRLRCTAPPTAFVTMKPKRVGSPGSRRATCSTACGVEKRRPDLTAARKSAALVTRLSLASTGGLLGGEFGATLATTSGQDGTAGAGTHAKPEPVHLGATTVVRLESSLAHSGISKAQLRYRPERSRLALRLGSQLIKTTALMSSGQTSGVALEKLSTS